MKKQSMKRIIYISLFTLLGMMLSLVVHVALEFAVIHLLTTDFQTYNLGLSWSTWFDIHKVGSVVLLLAGIVIGFLQGRFWWQRIYGGR